MSNDISTGIQGVQRGMAGMQKAASDIASAVKPNEAQTTEPAKTSQPKSITESLIDLKESRNLTEASVKVLKAEDQMIGELLDIVV